LLEEEKDVMYANEVKTKKNCKENGEEKAPQKKGRR